jgi:nitrate/nitrite transporter NarK
MMGGFYFATGWTPRLLEQSGLSAQQGISGGAATLIAAIAVGGFINASATGLFAIAPGLYPAAVRTTAVGWAAAFGRLGAIVSPILAGVLVDRAWSPSQLFILFAIPMIIAAFAVARSPGPDPVRRTAPPR